MSVEHESGCNKPELEHFYYLVPEVDCEEFFRMERVIKVWVCPECLAYEKE